MRNFKLYKYTFVLILIYFIATSSLFAYEKEKISSQIVSNFSLEEISYEPVTINTKTSFKQGSKKTKKAIKLATIKVEDTESDYDSVDDRAVPNINVDNFAANLSTISTDSNGNITKNISSSCTLVAKASIKYDDEYKDKKIKKTIDYWFEIDQFRMPLYRLQYEKLEAEKFSITLYYVIDDDNFSNEDDYFILDTFRATNFYLFSNASKSNNSIIEVPYYNGSLTENIVTATPQFDSNPFININANRPSGWTPTSFFDDLGSPHLAWIVSMQIEAMNAPSWQNYYVGMTIKSQNRFKLRSYDSGTGIKTIPYSIKLSKNNNNEIVDYVAGKGVKISMLRNNQARGFYIYVYTDFNKLEELNAGTFSDYIYLNFVSDFLSSSNDYIKIDAFNL